MQAPVDALDIVNGNVIRTDAAAGPSIGLADVARALAPSANPRPDRLPGLYAEGWFHADHMTYPYGVHIAVVAVDRETGAVTVERYVVASDIGRAVNPMLVEGQIVGGLVQGLGGALFEALRRARRALS
jgi:carbon-monoxide dehydrogenase large subunit/6-hydroxypseudooxynicotine dehydrogenase subunit gamma